MLEDDEHLAPFLRIPGKDNGFDVEGVEDERGDEGCEKAGHGGFRLIV